MLHRKFCVKVLAGIAASLCPLPCGYADDGVPPDVVVLINGGQLEGKVTEAKSGNVTVVTVELQQGGTIKLPKSQVRFIRRPKDAYAEYLDKKSKLEDTVDAHWEMSQWCKANLDSRQLNGPSELGPERRFHLNAILKLDPDHKQARYLLGYQKEKGEWINLEQKRQGHGFMRYNKRWLTPSEIAMEEADESWKDLQIECSRRLKKIRSSNTDEATTRAELNKIQEPAAVDAVNEMLNSEKSEDWQLALVDVLGNIQSPAAARALCDTAINHPNRLTQERAIARLKQEHIDKRLAAQYVARSYLRSDRNEIINRAGALLGEIGQLSEVLPLVHVLVTDHIVANPNARNPNAIQPSFSSDGSTGLQQGSPQPKAFKITKKNEAVLDALRRLTKADFGFDEKLWKDWYGRQYTLTDVDVRRDP